MPKKTWQVLFVPDWWQADASRSRRNVQVYLARALGQKHAHYHGHSAGLAPNVGLNAVAVCAIAIPKGPVPSPT